MPRNRLFLSLVSCRYVYGLSRGFGIAINNPDRLNASLRWGFNDKVMLCASLSLPGARLSDLFFSSDTTPQTILSKARTQLRKQPHANNPDPRPLPSKHMHTKSFTLRSNCCGGIFPVLTPFPKSSWNVSSSLPAVPVAVPANGAPVPKR